MNDEEMKQKQKRDQRLKVFEECFNKSSKCNEKEVKFWTKRPVVEKLHPERLFTVRFFQIFSVYQNGEYF